MRAVIVPNQQDLDRLMRGVDVALNKGAERLLNRLAENAVRQLRSFDDQLNHTRLSELWDHTEPTSSGDGFACEVFSHAEDAVFFNKTSAPGFGRVTSPDHSIDGVRLLSILEGGAVAHPIAAVNAETLAFPTGKASEPGTPANQISEFFAQGRGHATAMPASGGFVFPKAVEHPGVQANSNIAKTVEMLREGLDAMDMAAADEISVEASNA